MGTVSVVCDSTSYMPAGLITGQYPARWRITSFLLTRKGNADNSEVVLSKYKKGLDFSLGYVAIRVAITDEVEALDFAGPRSAQKRV